MTFLNFLAIYSLVGFTFFLIWMWIAHRNDRQNEEENAGSIDPLAYIYFAVMTTLLWPMALGLAVNGWWQRRKLES